MGTAVDAAPQWHRPPCARGRARCVVGGGGSNGGSRSGRHARSSSLTSCATTRSSRVAKRPAGRGSACADRLTPAPGSGHAARDAGARGVATRAHACAWQCGPVGRRTGLSSCLRGTWRIAPASYRRSLSGKRPPSPPPCLPASLPPFCVRYRCKSLCKHPHTRARSQPRGWDARQARHDQAEVEVRSASCGGTHAHD
jgi:hypothetical protein